MINKFKGAMMFTIQNRGQGIVETNYWDSDMAKEGILYLSWNAGAARLLVPDSMKSYIREMKTAKYVIVSRGYWINVDGRDALELLFEDDSDSPFAIQLSSDQCDRMLPQSDHCPQFAVSVWTSEGMVLKKPGKYRVVDEIPCLQEWNDYAVSQRIIY